MTDRRNPWPFLGLTGWAASIVVWVWNPVVAAVIAGIVVIGAPIALIAVGRAQGWGQP